MRRIISARVIVSPPVTGTIGVLGGVAIERNGSPMLGRTVGIGPDWRVPTNGAGSTISSGGGCTNVCAGVSLALLFAGISARTGCGPVSGDTTVCGGVSFTLLFTGISASAGVLVDDDIGRTTGALTGELAVSRIDALVADAKGWDMAAGGVAALGATTGAAAAGDGALGGDGAAGGIGVAAGLDGGATEAPAGPARRAALAGGTNGRPALALGSAGRNGEPDPPTGPRNGGIAGFAGGFGPCPGARSSLESAM